MSPKTISPGCSRPRNGNRNPGSALRGPSSWPTMRASVQGYDLLKRLASERLHVKEEQHCQRDWQEYVIGQHDVWMIDWENSISSPNFGAKTPNWKVFGGISEGGSTHSIVRWAWGLTVRIFHKTVTIEVVWIRVLRVVVHKLPGGYAGNWAHRNVIASALKDKGFQCFATNSHYISWRMVLVLSRIKAQNFKGRVPTLIERIEPYGFFDKAIEKR